MNIIKLSLDNIQSHILQHHWNFRPQYDEDAGVFVSTAEYTPIKSAAEFATISLARTLNTQLELTQHETEEFYELLETAVKTTPEIDRLLVTMEITRDIAPVDRAFIV